MMCCDALCSSCLNVSGLCHLNITHSRLWTELFWINPVVSSWDHRKHPGTSDNMFTLWKLNRMFEWINHNLERHLSRVSVSHCRVYEIKFTIIFTPDFMFVWLRSKMIHNYVSFVVELVWNKYSVFVIRQIKTFFIVNIFYHMMIFCSLPAFGLLILIFSVSDLMRRKMCPTVSSWKRQWSRASKISCWNSFLTSSHGSITLCQKRTLWK